MKKIVNDRPDNVCFGCSPWNERGLQLEFTQHPDGLVESPYTAPPHFCGAEGVIHGGSKRFQVHGLGQELLRTETDRFHGRFHLAVPRDDDDGRGDLQPVQAGQDLQSFHVGKPKIEQHDRRL